MGETTAEEEQIEGFLMRGGGRRTLSVDRALSLLTDERRRRLLFILRDTNGQEVPLDTVIDEIAANESIPGNGGVDREARESIRISLLHVHIPKLADADVVEYDSEGETLRYLEDAVLNAFLSVTEVLDGR